MRSPRSCRRTRKPDPKVTAQLDAVAKKNGFASYDDYNNVIDNIGLVIGGFDPATKKYVGTEAVIKAQIAEVQADKKMSAKDKKEALADLNEALKTPAPPIAEQGQYRPRRQILRQARGLLGGQRPAVSGRPAIGSDALTFRNDDRNGGSTFSILDNPGRRSRHSEEFSDEHPGSAAAPRIALRSQ